MDLSSGGQYAVRGRCYPTHLLSSSAHSALQLSSSLAGLDGLSDSREDDARKG